MTMSPTCTFPAVYVVLFYVLDIYV